LFAIAGDKRVLPPYKMHKGSRYFIITVVFLLLSLFELVSSSTTQLQTTKTYSHKKQVAVVSCIR